jgi:hypothetical protein
MSMKPDPSIILCRTCAGTGFDPKTSQRVRCGTCGGAGIVRSTDTLASFIEDPKHWHTRAQQMRTLAFLVGFNARGRSL